MSWQLPVGSWPVGEPGAPELRPCGCPSDAPGHREPEPDWIGDTPILHGESEYPVPGTERVICGVRCSPEMYCLCGHPWHRMCPGVWGDSIMDIELTRGENSD
jgi:hypothetical protein